MKKLTRIKKTLLPIVTLMTTTAISSGIVLSNIQSARADWFCWPWETGCQVDGNAGTSGNDLLGGARDGFIINVNNETGTRIWVDVEAYYNLVQDYGDNCANCNEPRWGTLGTWEFAPGERALILNGKDGVIGRHATFKARSDDGRVWEKEVDMGSQIGEFTFTFQ